MKNTTKYIVAENKKAGFWNVILQRWYTDHTAARLAVHAIPMKLRANSCKIAPIKRGRTWLVEQIYVAETHEHNGSFIKMANLR